MNIAIVGAGLIGLSCAWSLIQRGAAVSIFDAADGLGRKGASRAATGMIAPAYEAGLADGAHDRLFDLCVAGAQLWPRWLATLGDHGGSDSGYRPGPSFAVATYRGVGQIERLASALGARGVAFNWLDGDAVRRAEPALSRDIESALELPNDGWVDPKAVLSRLETAFRSRGGDVRWGAAIDLTGCEQTLARFDVVLDCTGRNASPDLAAITPVKGAALALKPGPGSPTYVIRSGDLYLSPIGGRLIVGATIEPGRDDERPDPAALTGLLDRATTIAPGLCGAEVIEAYAGVRPGTTDHGPLIGWIGERRYLAAGHYRNGVLLAPLTGEIVANHILNGERDDLAAAFDPSRAMAAAR